MPLWTTSIARSAFVLALAFPRPAAAGALEHTSWVGGYGSGSLRVSAVLRFTDDTSGSFELQSPNGVNNDYPFTAAPSPNGRMTITAAVAADTFRLAAARKGDRLLGTCVFRGRTEQCTFLKIETIDPHAYDSYAGAYRFPDGRIVALGHFLMGDGRDAGDSRQHSLSFAEPFTGRAGALISLSRTHFVAGPALGFDYPPTIDVTFEMDAKNEVAALVWKEAGTHARRGTRVADRREPVAFTNGDVQLAGTLVSPATSGRHPAVVLIHGSTPLTRYYFGEQPFLYMAYGFSVLTYDKRGCGASTGRFSASLPIETLAGDAAAAVSYLKSRTDIDSAHIGVHGHSQGGWIAPVVALQSPDVSFVVAGAASGWPTDKNIGYEIQGDMKGNGVGESDRAKALALWEMGSRVIRDNGEGWNEWRDALIKSHDEPWFRYARSPRSVMEMNDANRANIMQYIAREQRALFDPLPVWEKVRVPTLVYEGEYDLYVPAAESAALIREALRRAVNSDATVIVLPRSSHGLWTTVNPNGFEPLVRRTGYAEILNWMVSHARASGVARLPGEPSTAGANSRARR